MVLLAAGLQEMPGLSNQEVGEASQRDHKVCQMEGGVNESAEDACQVCEKHLTKGEGRKWGEKLQWEKQIEKRKNKAFRGRRSMPRNDILLSKGE